MHGKTHDFLAMGLIMPRKIKFYKHLYMEYDSFLRDVFYVFVLRNSDNDPMLKTVFWTASVALMLLLGLFLETR